MKISIQVKIVSVIIAVLLVSTAVSIYFTVNNQRQNLLEASERTLALNTEMLNLTIRNIMLSGEAPIAVRTMSSLKTIEEFEEISIYRTDGTIAFNDYRTIDAVNNYQDSYRFPRTPRVELQMIDNPNFEQVLETNTPVQVESVKARELEYYFPILNYSECRECHGDSGFVRGVAHFKISTAGIYDQINTARNILTIIFIGIGVIIAGLMILSISRIVISPILSISRTAEIVGQGNLDTRITLTSRDELGELGNTLNDMIDGLRERNELMVQNEVIEARNKENRKYLDTIQEGLLLLNKDYMISEQYSHYLTHLFETEDIAGRNFIDFVFPGEASQESDRKELAQFLDILFNNTVSDVDMIMQINPLKERTLTISRNGESKEIIIDVLYHRIVEDDAVENVMVIFQDKTDIVRFQKELEFERERSETELEHIAAILRAGPQAFVDFFQQANEAIDDVEENLGELTDRDTIDRLFRRMHSLKGSARYLEFRQLEGSTHEIETIIAGVRDEQRRPDVGKIRRLIETVRDELDSIQKINERFRHFSEVRLGSAAPSQKSQLINFVRTLKKMTEDIAAQLQKQVNFRAFGALADPSLLNKLRDPIIHLVRNALDHGIEDRFERLSAGKEEVGTIRVSFSEKEDQRIIEVGDDGKGIDFEVVRKRALDRGILKASEKDASHGRLLKILFSPSFSSLDHATDISGRGVGLDVVQDVVRELNGEISVATQENKGTKFILKIPKA